MKRGRCLAVTWHGRAPTRAELRAIAAALRSGRIQPGDHVAAARHVRCNPSPAEQSYRDFHWGNPPKRRRVVSVPADGEVFELGRLTAVEYETRKARSRATWRHEFSHPYPVLTSTADGRLAQIVGGAARVTKRGIEG